MSQPEKIAPAKLFLGLIFVNKSVLNTLKERVTKEFGPIDFESEIFNFSTPTHYYESEMGAPLKRMFLSFKNLIDPSKITFAKNRCAEIENEFSKEKRRRVNIDPGYIDFNKVVLASFKYGSRKIYIGDGVFADLTLFYEKGTFESLPWSFPDFKDGRYRKTLLEIRERLKKDWQK